MARKAKKKRAVRKSCPPFKEHRKHPAPENKFRGRAPENKSDLV